MADLLYPTVSAWLDDLDRQGKSALTCAGYRRALANFVHWSKQTYGQPFDPTTIIPRDVADWKAFQQAVKGAKLGTINQRLVAVPYICDSLPVAANPGDLRGLAAILDGLHRPKEV